MFVRYAFSCGITQTGVFKVILNFPSLFLFVLVVGLDQTKQVFARINAAVKALTLKLSSLCCLRLRLCRGHALSLPCSMSHRNHRFWTVCVCVCLL